MEVEVGCWWKAPSPLLLSIGDLEPNEEVELFPRLLKDG